MITHDRDIADRGNKVYRLHGWKILIQ
jgi:ABC-type lipoprotein export system ATPase subunit